MLNLHGATQNAQLEEINRQWTTADDIWPKPVQQPRPWLIVGGRAKPRTVNAAITLSPGDGFVEIIGG